MIGHDRHLVCFIYTTTSSIIRQIIICLEQDSITRSDNFFFH